MIILPACMCLYYVMPGARGRQKKVSDPLELELQWACHHVDGNGTGSSARTVVLNHQAISGCLMA